ncbi:MAG TPA: isochorismatase family cysteine hydrolase [Chloroflexia bacterium]|nr:isochorismatase family cysteine hydrolase [Chloroflexia bacterium]
MSEQFTLNKDRSALLIMDYQNDILGNVLGKYPGLLDRATRTLDAARQASLPVIYVVSSFRPGYPEVGPDNRAVQRIRAAGILREGTPGVEINSRVAPQEGEVVVVKRRAGAFSTTDLATILRAGNITSLILMGVLTSGVVLSTVRWGADTDYDLTVIEDCCADGDEEVHRVLTQKVLPMQARVVKSDDLIAALV